MKLKRSKLSKYKTNLKLKEINQKTFHCAKEFYGKCIILQLFRSTSKQILCKTKFLDNFKMLKIGEKIFENFKFRVNYSTMKTKTVEIKKVKFSHRRPHCRGNYDGL